MKYLKILLILCIISTNVTAQNYQTVEEVDNVCSQLGFASDEEAQIAVDKILNEMGIPTKSFKLRSCPNINNAIAKNIKDENGNYGRYILYDINFMKRISDNAQNDWSAISVLAHEIGHHLSGHSLNNKGSNHQWELEADYFSGVSLAKMGASLQESQSAIQTLRYEKATSTHPAKADRLTEIEKGWIAGGGSKNTSIENIASSKAFNDYSEITFKDSKVSNSEFKTPPPSPSTNYTTEIGGTYFNLKYSRPSAKGRKIFGDLYPYGELWKTGANENTTINFTEDIYIQNKLLKAGTYSIFTTPGPSKWTIYFYSDYNNFGTPKNWDQNKVMLSLDVPKLTMSDTQESFLLRLEATGTNSGALILTYENSKIKIPLEAATSTTTNISNSKSLQQVGLTEIQLEYNNVIAGIDNSYIQLIEKITFENEVVLCGKNIKAGTYKVLGKRSADGSLSIQLEQKNRKLGSTEVTGTSVIDICTMRALTTDRVDENFFVAINDLTDLDATLNFYIDSKKYKYSFQVPTHKRVEEIIKSIEDLGAATSNDYYSFATYYFKNDLDTTMAKEFIDKADAMEPGRFWVLNDKSMIYYKLGNKNQAITIAKNALEFAKKANNNYYVFIIEANLNAWQ